MKLSRCRTMRGISNEKPQLRLSEGAGCRCPHGDSNPGFGLERATSWATRRWGQPRDFITPTHKDPVGARGGVHSKEVGKGKEAITLPAQAALEEHKDRQARERSEAQSKRDCLTGDAPSTALGLASLRSGCLTSQRIRNAPRRSAECASQASGSLSLPLPFSATHQEKDQRTGRVLIIPFKDRYCFPLSCRVQPHHPAVVQGWRRLRAGNRDSRSTLLPCRCTHQRLKLEETRTLK